jgi:hypothetical protein
MENVHKYSTKLYNIGKNLEAGKGIHLIYSNFVAANTGTSLIRDYLISNGYNELTSNSGANTSYKNFVVFDGTKTSKFIETYRQQSNKSSNKDGSDIKILVVSSVISEGITFKNVRHVHFLEPAWNLTVMRQVIGRTVRNHSHKDLPFNDRNVRVYKYCAVGPQTDDIIYIDEYKYKICEEKDIEIKSVERLLKEIAIDCNTNSFINKAYHARYRDNDPECDYTRCNFECNLEYNKLPKDFNKTIYDTDIQMFNNYYLLPVNLVVKRLFTEYYIWSLRDITKAVRNNTSNEMPIELIYTVLDDFLTNKKILRGVSDNDGYLIKRADLIIFNGIGANERASLYEKNTPIRSKPTDFIEYTILNTKKVIESAPDISTEIEEYNEEIRTSFNIYITYRGRGQYGQYGKYDGKMRFVHEKDYESSDARKKAYGRVASTIDKNGLIEIATELNLQFNASDEKSVIVNKIKEHLEANGMVMR